MSQPNYIVNDRHHNNNNNNNDNTDSNSQLSITSSNSNSQLHNNNDNLNNATLFHNNNTTQQQPLSLAEQSRAALRALDDAPISLFHLKTILVAGSGFLCDAYDLQCIGMVTNLIGRLYYPDWRYWSTAECQSNSYVLHNTYPSYLDPKNQANSLSYIDTKSCHPYTYTLSDGVSKGQSCCGSAYYNKGSTYAYTNDWQDHVPSALPLPLNFALNGVALCGTLAGQLLFGYLGDKFGRKRMFVISLCLMITFAFMSGFTLGSGPGAMMWSLLWFRFMLGVGIGGDYPLSATLMSEYGGKNNRGALVAAVFAMQGTGYLLASAWCAAMGAAWKNSGADPDYLWRCILMFGAFPTLCSLYSRVTMTESPRFTLLNQAHANTMLQDVDRFTHNQSLHNNNNNATTAIVPTAGQQPSGMIKQDQRTFSDFIRQYGLILLGTAGCWFMLDVAFYSQGLYQNVIYSNIGWVPSAYTMTPADEVLQIAKAQTYVNLASTVPGYWFTVFTVEHLGRWKIQMGGFLLMTLFMGILSGMYNTLYHNTSVFIGLYCMTFFFANWGPNATTFVVPAEVFPSKFRTLGHGISAAAGKTGSIVGVFGFKYMTLYTGSIIPNSNNTRSLGPALGLLTGCLGIGALLTLLVPETKGKSLEELGNDEIQDIETSIANHNDNNINNNNKTSSSNNISQIKDIDYYAAAEKNNSNNANDNQYELTNQKQINIV